VRVDERVFLRRPSVNDELVEADAAAKSRLTPEERFALALQLGERDAQVYAAAHGVTIEEARAVLKRNRGLGRTPSKCNG
jgi:endonuclease V-like protein UPF0215 family